MSAREGALIEKSILCNITLIGEHFSIEKSLVSEKYILRRGAEISPRCFLDRDVIIDSDCQGIRFCSLLSTLPNSAFTPEEDFEDGDGQAEPVQRLVQPGGLKMLVVKESGIE